MQRALAWCGHAGAILVLTVLTQVGGVIYAAALLLRRHVPLPGRPGLALLSAFAGLYALTWFPIERVARLTGREGLPCLEQSDSPLRSASLYCVLHRHYVRPELRDIAGDMARAVNRAHPGTLTQTLDASFPFFDGFPLAPHLSHDDGEKLDLAFYYADDEGYQRGVLASPIGYWAFEEPAPEERQPCGESRGLSFRWDQGWFGVFTRDDLAMDEARTRAALRWLSGQSEIGRIFIEPHLADRLGIHGSRVRFQGCRAARHDDHLHIQLR